MPLLYYITDRTQLAAGEAERRRLLQQRIAAAGQAGIDFVQLREKDLSARELERLAREAVQALAGTRTRLLVNTRIDVALAVGGDGVHLPAGDLPADEARALLARVSGNPQPLVAVSCHTAAEVAHAESHGADFAVFGPVFEKQLGEKEKLAGTGVEALRAACQRAPAAARTMPVLALGGVTLENAAACLEAGAAGIAAIRLFQSGEIGDIVTALRGLNSPAGEPARHPHHPR